jgi:hypothetical protein
MDVETLPHDCGPAVRPVMLQRNTMKNKGSKSTTPETAPVQTETPAAAPAAPAAPAPATPPAPAAPAAPAPVAATAAAKEEKKLSIAEFTAMKLADLTTFVKSAVELAENIKTARETEKNGRKENAKAVADLKRRYAHGKDEGTVPADWTFASYFEKVIGGKCPGRLQSLASLFNSLVMLDGPDGKPLLTETVYDDAALDWLEKANAIISAAQKQHGEQWKTSPDVQACIAALSKPGDAAEVLDQIRKRQKGEAAPAESAAAAPLTAEMAVEFLIGFYTEQAKVVASKPGHAKEIFCRCHKLAGRISEMNVHRDEFIETMSQTYDQATIQGWMEAHRQGVAGHVEVIKAFTGDQPATNAPAETTPAAPAPVETAPVETAPVETAPVETAPVETAPVETAPVETAPVETAPVADLAAAVA